MKRYTSRFLKSVAVFYMLFPISYLLVAAILFDMPMSSCVRLVLSPSYYFVAVIAILAGYGLWEMYRWGWYLYIFSNLFVAYQTAVVMNQYSEAHHRLIGFIVALLTIIGIAFRVSREIRVPYFFPKIRWWESNPRYRLAVATEITRKISEQLVTGEILDVSMSGCFIKIRGDLKPDEPVRVKFEVFKIPITVDGLVVWNSESTVTHPRGVGVKFSALERVSKRGLRLVTKRLKEIAHFYRTSRYLLSPEDFLKKLEEIEKQEFRTRKKKKIQVTESVS